MSGTEGGGALDDGSPRRWRNPLSTAFTARTVYVGMVEGSTGGSSEEWRIRFTPNGRFVSVRTELVGRYSHPGEDPESTRLAHGGHQPGARDGLHGRLQHRVLDPEHVAEPGPKHGSLHGKAPFRSARRRQPSDRGDSGERSTEEIPTRCHHRVRFLIWMPLR